MEEGGLYLRNLSPSGTRVNGRRVDSDVRVFSGDLIEIGLDDTGGDVPALTFRLSSAFDEDLNVPETVTLPFAAAESEALVPMTFNPINKPDLMMEDLAYVRSLPKIDHETLVAIECQMVTRQC